MASRTYPLTALVVRTTKLGETDKIVTLLAQDGSQARAVAKGARKPGSRFGAAFELGCELDLLCSRGKSLDIATEARIVDPHTAAHADLEHQMGLAVMCDLVSRVSVQGQPLARLYPMTCAALGALESADVGNVPIITAAQILKTVSVAGFRPSLHACAICGEELAAPGEHGPRERFSHAEGGRLCGECAPQVETVSVSSELLLAVDACIRSTFAELSAFEPDPALGLDALRFCQTWLAQHLDISMKSLSFFLSSWL